MFNVKSKKISAQTLQNLFYACKQEKEKANAKELVGVSFYVDSIKEQFPVKNQLQEVYIDKKRNVLSVVLTFNPNATEADYAKLTYLKTIATPTEHGSAGSDWEVPTDHSDTLTDIITPESSFSNLQTYSFLFEFSLDAVEMGAIVIDGCLYRQVRIVDERPLAQETLHLFLVFTKKEYDGLSFLGNIAQRSSFLRNYSKISARGTKAILSALSYPSVIPNMLVSSQVVGGAIASLLPSTEVYEVEEREECYRILGLAGDIEIPKHTICSSSIQRLSKSIYAFRITTGKYERVVLYLSA